MDDTVSRGYNGKRMDSFTGMYNYGFRDYSLKVKRFTTVDRAVGAGLGHDADVVYYCISNKEND